MVLSRVATSLFRGSGIERGWQRSSAGVSIRPAFRDLLGEINQIVARVASTVLLLVAGLPLVLKGEAIPQVTQ